jgi:cation:H+ antiporter
VINGRRRHLGFIFFALLGTLPAVLLTLFRLTSDYHAPPIASSVLYGIGILSAAFLLSWGAEAAEHDISHSLALASLAIITVLPEYAVDFTLAWKAGSDPAYGHYAIANMTGANRLLIGLAWPLIILLTWLKRRRSEVHLHRNQAIEVGFLGVATLYAFKIPLTGRLDLIDAVVLISLFIAYMWFNARAEVVEPELIGPAALIGNMPAWTRRVIVLFLFVFAATVIFASAEPFAEGMIETGAAFGIDEFLLIQWVAPLASEAPEILLASIFALRGDAASALGMLISAKVNQWTLLVGSLPVVYAVSTGSLSPLALDTRQTEEVLLTASQSLFAVVLLAGLFLTPRGALALFVLFITQLVIPIPAVRFAFSGVYAAATALLLAFNPPRRRAAFSLPHRALQEGYLVGTGQEHERTLEEPVNEEDFAPRRPAGRPGERNPHSSPPPSRHDRR